MWLFLKSFLSHEIDTLMLFSVIFGVLYIARLSHSK